MRTFAAQRHRLLCYCFALTTVQAAQNGSHLTVGNVTIDSETARCYATAGGVAVGGAATR